MLQEHPVLHWPEPDFVDDLRQLFLKHHQNKAPIAIFGDYDADGLSGSSVLSVFLRGAGFAVTPRLPTRSEGYGLNTQSLQALIDAGHKLLITVDCGISNREEIAFCRAQGMEVVITDHHGLPDLLPEAEFTLHPEVLKIKALANLSGAGMAYWLTHLLFPSFSTAPDPERLLDLAVLGTLADMTPLRGLNFALARRGLQAFRDTQRPGLLALSQLKKVDLTTLTEDDLTFRMIPLLNAAGRIDSPQPALDLLLSESGAEAERLARDLENLNKTRQTYCKEVMASALKKLENHDQEVIVLADESWPHGVLGITCSQLVSQYHQPVALMAIEGAIAKASLRAPKGFNILAALQACEKHLLRFGGHEMAGGLSIAIENIEAFARDFESVCRQQQQDYVHTVDVDMALNPRLLNLELWNDTRKLAPFGMGNPAPLLLSLKAPLKDLKSDKKSERHLFAQLGSQIRIKAWDAWDPAFENQSHFDLLYRLDRNTWRGQHKLELTVEHLRVSPSEAKAVRSASRNQATSPAPVTSIASPEAPPVPTAIRAQRATPEPANLPAATTQSPHDFEAEQPYRELPGYFYAHQKWWQIPGVRYTQAVEWHDARSQNQTPAYSVHYRLSCPPDAVLHPAAPGQFSGVVIQNLPDPSHWAVLCTHFHDLYLAPLHQETRFPDFLTLRQVIHFLSESTNASIRSAQELAQRMHFDRYQAKICLRTLCDLGLLTYDRERYYLSYKNQVYHLKKSAFYQEQHRFWQARRQAESLWHSLQFERLKNLLMQEVTP